MPRYKTVQNDVLDEICQKRYGHTHNTFQVLEHNRHLGAYPLVLPAGVVIDLPSFDTQKTTAINLWD